MNALKGWRTLAVNIATLVVLLGGALTGTIEDADTLRYIAIGLTVANVVLRWLTTGPVAPKV